MDRPRRGHDVRVPESASEDEAAAIAAAIEAYLAAERAAADDRERSWAGRRWTFAARTQNLSGRAVRIPDGAPADAWTAAGRADRL